MAFIIESFDRHYLKLRDPTGTMWTADKSEALQFGLKQSAQCVIDHNKYKAEVIEIN